jgi:hypothetical protein
MSTVGNWKNRRFEWRGLGAASRYQALGKRVPRHSCEADGGLVRTFSSPLRQTPHQTQKFKLIAIVLIMIGV